jgi:hypothetical protein
LARETELLAEIAFADQDQADARHLGDEYRTLVDAIVAENLEDRSGALSRLEQIRVSIRSNRHIQNLPELERVLEQIYTNHQGDGEIAWSLSLTYEMLGNVEAQLETLGITIEQRFNEARARSKRALLLSRDPKNELAKEDLRAVVLASDVSVADLVNGLERLREIDQKWLEFAETSSAIRKLRGADLKRVADALMVDHRGSQFVLDHLSDELEVASKNRLVLAAIGSRDYQRAMKVIGAKDYVLASSEVEDVFNLACAEWGQYGEPPSDLFMRVVELVDNERLHASIVDPNFLQCLAMTHYILGDYIKAVGFLRRSQSAVAVMPPMSVFSCWRYFNVKRGELRSDLQEMEVQMKNRGKLVPRFLEAPALI